MKTLLQVWPWWSVALLSGNISLAGAVLAMRFVRKSVSGLSAFRAYLWYSFGAGSLLFVMAAITPVGKLWYWYTFAGLCAGFNLVLLLLCAQVVDQLIRRDDVQRVKKLWLCSMPVLLGLSLMWNNVYPYFHVQKWLAFDAVCALVSAFVLFGTYITPDEDWIAGYKTVVLGLAWQIVSMALMNLVEVYWRSEGLRARHVFPVDILGPLASMGTLVIFLTAAMKSEPALNNNGHSQVSQHPEMA